MTVKSKVDFLNAVASGNKIPCPECGSENKAEARFCTICGNALVKPVVTENKPVEVAIAKKVETAVDEKVFQPTIMIKKSSEAPVKPKIQAEAQAIATSIFEEKSALADGLPQWTLEPPQVLVKRRNRR